MPLDFFLDFFGVGEIWSAIDMSARGKQEGGKPRGSLKASVVLCNFLVDVVRPLKQGTFIPSHNLLDSLGHCSTHTTQESYSIP